MLLQAVAQSKNQGLGASQVGYINACGHFCGDQSQRAMAIVPEAGYANGYDQQMAQGLLSVKDLWVNIHYPATAR